MVTIDVWRAQIGCHHARRFGSFQSSMQPAGGCVLLSVTAFHFLIFSILLVIGNVELNPGPETFQCSFCGKECSSLGTHCTHQKIHSNVFNYSFECGECFLQFSSFQSLTSHVSRVHKEERKVTSSKGAQNFPCPHCQQVLQSFPALAQHLLSTHVEVDDNVTCPLQVECDRTEPFATKNAFRGHLSKQHPGWRGNDSQEGSSGDATFVPPVGNIADILHDDFPDDFLFCSDDDVDSDDQYFDAEEFFVYSEKDVFDFIARFYLMLEVDCLISVASIGKICESLAVMSEMVQARIRETLFGELQSLNLETGQIKQILSKVSCSDPFYLAHHKRTIGLDMTSSHLRKKHFKEAFPQVPVLYPNFEPRDSIDGDRYAYVSLKDSLSHLLNDPSVQKEVSSSFERFAVSQSSDNTILSDYTDGEVCKRRNLPPKRIDLIVFQDAFSVTSMLTNVQNKHKTLGVYFTLGNLPSWMRSRLRAMHLIMLILEKHCKKYRQLCWEKLKEELKELEEGIDFMGERIPVCLQFFVGDNLGSHFLGGFVEGFRASHFCRFCEVSLAEFEKNIVAQLPLRSQQRYELCAMRATEKKHCFAVKQNSVFNQLKNFKVCDPGLPPCLGHDLLHGVAEWDLKSILQALVKKKWFTFDLLNRRIAIFKYSSSDIKNKPAPISIPKGKKKTKTRLGGSAVQNWKLLQLLPFIVQDLIIDPQDPHWQLFLTLKEMVEYICAPKILRTQVDYLDGLIIKYLQDRKVLPTKHKPKHHFLRHYATLILKFGPLIHLWAMRFEQKHQFFKRVAKTCNNFINILKTLSQKCQLLFAYESGGARFSGTIQGAQPCNIDNSSFPPDVVAAISSQNLDSVKAYKSVCINGILYKKGDLLILRKVNADLSVGWIEAIILDGVIVSFVLRNETAVLNQQMGIYHIQSSGGALSVAKQNALPYPCVQPVYSFGDLDSFSLRHSII